MNRRASHSAERVRLAVVTPVHWRSFMGGAQYQVKCLLDYLVPSGRFDVHYITRRAPESGHLDEYQIHPIGRPGPKPRLGFAMDAPRLLSQLRALQPHVIYQRVGCAYTGIAAWYARKAGIPMVWHVASDADVTPRLKTAGRNPIRRAIDQCFLEYGIRRADIVICQTEQQSALMQEHYGRAADEVVPNFHPEPRESSAVGEPLRIVWIANFKPIKQPDAFVRLAMSLQDLDGVRFVMIGAASDGSGDVAWSREIMRRIATAPNIDYIGQRTQEEVNAALSSAYLFVNTSRYEGFPNTFIQAWLRRVPVLSLHVNPDGVFDRTEIGVYAGTEQRLCEVTRDLVRNPGDRNRMAVAAQVYAQMHHSMANAARIESLLLGRVLSSRGSQATASPSHYRTK